MMTAREFIESRFGVIPEERDQETGELVAPERFVAVEAGDLDPKGPNLYGLANPKTVGSPYIASLPFWIEIFGPTFEAAYNAGKRGQELLGALLATPGGTRGWDLYFRLWHAKGLLN